MALSRNRNCNDLPPGLLAIFGKSVTLNDLLFVVIPDKQTAPTGLSSEAPPVKDSAVISCKLRVAGFQPVQQQKHSVQG